MAWIVQEVIDVVWQIELIGIEDDVRDSRRGREFYVMEAKVI